MSDTTETPVIQLTALTKRYGLGDACVSALDGVNLKIEKGEFIAIMGPSGCGKTTLLNVLGLLDHADDGEYLLDGKAVNRLGSSRHAHIRSNQIGMVFQSFNLINRLTVLENVALPLTYKGIARTKRLERASDVLKTFHLSEREYYMPWQLSGGQMQRVAIARALVNEPSIILADEPTGNLDSRSSHVIMEELSELHKKGNTIIMVTHNPNLTSYASRVINMLDGKIASDTKIAIQLSDEGTVKIPLNRKINRLKAEHAKTTAALNTSPAEKRAKPAAKSTKKAAPRRASKKTTKTKGKKS
ncbi:MAG: ABC transporter ATP-binding protein [Candidatus Saccharimonas sp.]